MDRDHERLLSSGAQALAPNSSKGRSFRGVACSSVIAEKVRIALGLVPILRAVAVLTPWRAVVLARSSARESIAPNASGRTRSVHSPNCQRFSRQAPATPLPEEGQLGVMIFGRNTQRASLSFNMPRRPSLAAMIGEIAFLVRAIRSLRKYHKPQQALQVKARSV